ncbi:PPC domain-containing protein [Flindersiella endophytica]
MPDHSDLRRNRPTRRGIRRVALALGVSALTAPLALIGVDVSAAAPESERNHVSGGIDGDALRQRISREKPKEVRAAANAPRLTEREAAGGNDRIADAERMPRPQARHDWTLRIDGTLKTEQVTPVDVEPNQEDDGAIPLARDLELGGQRRGISTTGEIGDGPHGSKGTKTGDYDFYRVDAAAGDTLDLDLDPGGELTPNALLYDANGNVLIGAQDLTGSGAVHLSHPIERAGTYYLAVGTYIPKDPFDPASGLAVMTEGPYQLDVTLRSDRMADTDVYAIPLRKGDVLGTTVSGSARRIAIHQLDGELVQGSAVDVGPIYPADSPLPRGGNATANHVVEQTGLYYVAVSDGSGDYSLTVASHPAPSTKDEPPQTVLLDFSGPTFDNRVFGAAVVTPGVREVSPMRDFLPRWGLQESDEQAVIEGATERVREILRDDIPGSKVRITNSLEDPDLFGKPGVSRVIVGGTVEEAGLLPAFGLSQSIDPGNFVREETAIVMPELMSGDENPASLNHFMTDDSDRIRAVGQAVGNVTGHEIGHFLGNFHTDDYDDHTNVMNTGNLLEFFAAGPDGVAGTADDERIGMRTSAYDLLQGLSGVESTPARTSVALRGAGRRTRAAHTGAPACRQRLRPGWTRPRDVGYSLRRRR